MLAAVAQFMRPPPGGRITQLQTVQPLPPVGTDLVVTQETVGRSHIWICCTGASGILLPSRQLGGN